MDREAGGEKCGRSRVVVICLSTFVGLYHDGVEPGDDNVIYWLKLALQFWYSLTAIWKFAFTGSLMGCD